MRYRDLARSPTDNDQLGRVLFGDFPHASAHKSARSRSLRGRVKQGGHAPQVFNQRQAQHDGNGP